ncbi:MAG TPA: sigma 54-interacting transcriptional regulator [Verrucomicrobiae bacterium]|nr:sigma 54-interacting transcriptional regulator [Verrucomicrobiae bacterium]
MSTAAPTRHEKPVADPGDPAALLARTQDMSRRLQEREEFYRSILESLGEGIIITDRESRILYANSRIECLTGRTRAELIGAVSYELLSPREEWPAMRRRLKARLAGKEEAYELEHIRKDGGRHWVSVRALPYRNARGDIVGTLGLVSCIKERKTLEYENEYLQEELRGNYSAILGDSPALKKVLAQIEMVAPTNANVLILGESGTGKELVARAIHDRSPRKAAALVRVNCASVPRELFESEFFGHVRGAFTGAVKDRVGRFELAHGGTLFLDEIGEVPLELQSKLLRVLQEGQFEKVGEDRTRTVDVRIIAATNRDLEADVKTGRFRQDLYYRLSVFPIELPPLRERVEDVPALAQHFLLESARKLGAAATRLTPAQVKELQSYEWPGNVRELQNVIERAVIRSRNGHLELGLRPSGAAAVRAPRKADSAPMSEPASLHDLKQHERAFILDALARTHGKIYGPDGAAALLGLKPTTLSSKVHRMGLKKIDPARKDS